jgi:D-proline reductase (dithiol) PrdB
MGDTSLRLISKDVEPTNLRVAYPYLDMSGAEEDINTVFPITRLQELEEESFIDSIADVHPSFMGYLPDPSEVDVLIESAVTLLEREKVNLALLTPADVLSHQTMAILQRGIESAGVATISVALCRDLVERIGVPRAVHYPFPFGYTFGDANDEATQLRILKEVLRSGHQIDETGKIVDLPYEWMDL